MGFYMNVNSWLLKKQIKKSWKIEINYCYCAYTSINIILNRMKIGPFWNQYTVVWWLRTLMRGYSRSEIQMWLPWEILFSSLMDQAIKDKDLTSTVVNVIMTFCLCKSMMKETIQLWRRRWFDTARRYHTIKKKWK